MRTAPRLLLGAAGAIAISEAVGRDGRAVLGPLPVRVVYNAIDVRHFTPGPGDGAQGGDRLAAQPGAHRVGVQRRHLLAGVLPQLPGPGEEPSRAVGQPSDAADDLAGPGPDQRGHIIGHC